MFGNIGRISAVEQEDPDDSTDYVIPTVSASTSTNNSLIGSLWDYFGLPINTTNNITGINALPFRGVYLIYNEWFRDENLQKSVKIEKGDANLVISTSRLSEQPSWVINSSSTDAYPGFACPPRGKRHDYFTSALPWTQKGPGVSIGLAGTATLVDPSPVSGYFVQQSDANLGAAQLSADAGVHDVYTGSGTLRYQGGYSVSIAGIS